MKSLREQLRFDPANNGTRVVVAMSGGVDSSVAAAILAYQGYDVVGLMMRLWSEPGPGGSIAHNRCCTPDQMADARRVAAQLSIPFYVVDVQEYFRRQVVQFFIDEHTRGRTPNPCFACNRQVRFTYLLERAISLEAAYLATGHYARVTRSPTGFQLRQALDLAKDQSYVLHVLTQRQLSRVLFPVGPFTKAEIRQLAREFALPVAEKSESQDLCFLGDGDYRRFLAEHAPALRQPGVIRRRSGEVLGQHRGLPFYTVGQRKGLGISASEPLFVLEKDGADNSLIVGTRAELGRTTFLVQGVNWIAGQPPTGPVEAAVKIRYRARPVPAMVEPRPGGVAHIRCHDHVYGVTAGQGAVFYQEDVCLGGGLIADENASQGAVT